MSFFKSAQRPLVSVDAFIKQNSGNTVKYSGVAKELHKIYFPYTILADGTKALVAQTAEVHDIRVSPDKYESCICLKGITRQDEATGKILNDGTCPFCDRLSSAYDIKNYREELAIKGCGKTGKDLEDYQKNISRQFMSEMKVSKGKPKAYVLVAKFTLDANGMPVAGANGLPAYEIKVMALSSNRLEQIDNMFKTAGMSMAGGEMTIKYPDTKDARLLVSQSQMMPSFGPNSITQAYPAVVDAIQKEAADFDWETIENSFPEWKGMTTEQAAIKCATMFGAWDTYVAEKIANPNALYLEYNGVAAASQPALEASAQPMPQMAPQAQATPQMTPQAQPQATPQGMPMGQSMGMPQAAPQGMPQPNMGDIQSVFGGLRL